MKPTTSPGTYKGFSGKKKKAQLKEKRLRKHQDEQRMGSEDPPHEVAATVEAAREKSGTEQASNGLMVYGEDRKGVRSVFQKESREEIEARKRLSYEPLAKRHFAPHGVPYGSWFRMPWADDGAEGGPSAALKEHPAAEHIVNASGSFPFSVMLPTRVVALHGAPPDPTADEDGASSNPVSSADDTEDECTSSMAGSERDVGRSSRESESVGEAVVKIAGEPRNPIEERENRYFAKYVRHVDNYPLPPALKGMQVSSYERNPDVWRQLWRTVEISDVVIIVADARYPMVHLPLSLLTFIIKDNKKECVVVMNKADLVPKSTLDQWIGFLTAYFTRVGLIGGGGMSAIPIEPFTSLPAEETAVGDDTVEIDHRRKKKKRNQKLYEQLRTGKLQYHTKHSDQDGGDESNCDDDDDDDDAAIMYDASENFKGKEKAQRELLHDKRKHKELETVSQMITNLLRVCVERGSVARHERVRGDHGARPLEEVSHVDTVHIGFVGHPNVGKSSLINCIRGTKVVSVSATAGHTKHVQTIVLPNDGVTLVDCPGLAFPTFGLPRPLQAVIGTHQIAQTRDPQSGVAYLAARLPLERLFGLTKLDSDDTVEWSPYELCESYAKKKGFFVKRGKGALDTHRAAIEILKEAYEGRLVLYHAPPEKSVLFSNAFSTEIEPYLLLSDVLSHHSPQRVAM